MAHLVAEHAVERGARGGDRAAAPELGEERHGDGLAEAERRDARARDVELERVVR